MNLQYMHYIWFILIGFVRLEHAYKEPRNVLPIILEITRSGCMELTGGY